MADLVLRLKISEILFLLVGVGMLLALPWLDSWGIWVWLGTKFMYFFGVFLFIFHK